MTLHSVFIWGEDWDPPRLTYPLFTTWDKRVARRVARRKKALFVVREKYRNPSLAWRKLCLRKGFLEGG